MSQEPCSYRKAPAVRLAALLLALLMGITVVGIPISLWLVAVALRRVELDAEGIRVQPGRAMKWAEVARFGIGFKSGELDPGSSSPLRTTTAHLILQDQSGRRLAVHITNYEQSRVLMEEIKQRVGHTPERLKTSFLFQRLSFPDR